MQSVGPVPIPGERYQHFLGGVYEIVCVAVQEDFGAPLVIYKPVKVGDDRVWARPLWNFLQRVTYLDKSGGTAEKARFELLTSAPEKVAGALETGNPW